MNTNPKSSPDARANQPDILPGPDGQASCVENARSVCASVHKALPDTASSHQRIRQVKQAVQECGREETKSLRRLVDHVAAHALTLEASDLDFGGHGEGYVWYRVDGRKQRCEALGTYSATEAEALILSLLGEKQLDQLLNDGAVHFSYTLQSDDETRRFRASVYVESDHVALTLRVIPDDTRTLDALGVHPQMKRRLLFTNTRSGLTLITGETGAGKSTTLDAIIDANNCEVPGHIVVIADPIEYRHESKKCLVRHREVGRDVQSVKAGITQALRQDPDIVVIGELRDPKAIAAALEIADSGHRVFSTLHTASAQETIDRIVAEMPAEEQSRVRHRLADVLRSVISQKLLPQRREGRVLAKEVLWVNSSARAAIKNDNVSELYQMMWQGGSEGQTTLEQDLHRLVRKREITPESAVEFANNPRRLHRLL